VRTGKIQAIAALGLTAILSGPALAETPDKRGIAAFVAAAQKATSTGEPEDIEAYVAFMTPDVVDEHVPYGVEFTGRDFFRENLPNKAQTVVSLTYSLDRIVRGQDFALVSYDYESIERAGEETVTYTGRWILSLEYDEAGLVKRIRRFRG
jgi:ketosteroid isomerase-like protein